MNYEILFLQSLATTVVIETAVLFLLNKYFIKLNQTKTPIGLILFLGVFCSLATLPYVWFILPYFIKDKQLYIAASEILAWLAESMIYFFVLKINFKKALLISLFCNLVSFIIGLFIF